MVKYNLIVSFLKVCTTILLLLMTISIISAPADITEIIKEYLRSTVMHARLFKRLALRI